MLKKTDVQKTKNYLLEIYDAVSASNILKGFEAQEISNVRLLGTEYIALEALKIELKGKATLKAKRQAEEMVKTIGQKLGPAIFISDLDFYASNSNRANVGLNFSSNTYLKEFESADISFDKITVSATVEVHFRLE